MINRTNLAARIALAGLMLSGLAIRIPHLADPPLEFHPTRQYRSAITARGYVVRTLKGYSAAELNAIRAAAAVQNPIEPPVLEHAAALAYRMIGHEALWMPRLMSVVSWVLGALGVWWLVVPRRDSDANAPRAVAGLVAVAVYLFLPFGRAASQAFQPDALMTALAVAAMAAVACRQRTPSLGSSLMALALTSAALFIKPMAVFFVLPAAFALTVVRRGFFKSALRFAGWTALAMAPAVAWYIYVALTFPSTFEDRFFPQLLTRASFWMDWQWIVGRVVTRPILLLALLGVALAERETRRVLVAAWSGYVAFGLVFTHHIHTHDYYSLPLLPLVAWSIGSLVVGVWPRARRESADPAMPKGRFWNVVLPAIALVVVAAAMVRAWRTPMHGANPRSVDEAARYERIGSVVNHSTRVVSLDGSYGAPLNYHGRLLASNLPLSIDRGVSVLAGRSATSEAEAELAARNGEFFVGTLQPEFDAWPGLGELLNQRYPLIEREGKATSWRYVVYDLRRTRISLTPERMSAFARVVAGDPARRAAGQSPSTAADRPVQTVRLWAAAGARWRLVVSRPDLVDISPLEGTGPATIAVSARGSLADADTAFDVSAYGTADTAPSGTLKLRVRTVRADHPAPPEGAVDQTGDAVVVGAAPILITGWALDDIGLRRIWVGYQSRAGSVVSLGDAVRRGARRDVAAAHPLAFDVYNCSWEVRLHPDLLRNQSLPLVLHVYAEDTDGLRTEIGTRTVTR